jgi:2-polyprenyl-6-methoxyphenol hydroxylase-like FAD-dependent oxidoreductase
MRHSRTVADRDAQFDLIIAGGGMTGLALACTVADAKVPVLLIEQRPLPDTTALAFDGRVTAIARGSRHLLEGIGIWPHLAEEAQPILDIEVGERHSPLTVHYDHRAVGGEPLGHIVENRVIRRALLRRLAELSTGALEVAAPERGELIERRTDLVEIALASGQRVRARLLAAADGRGSRLRDLADIGVTRWNYRQTGIVAIVAHAEPHRGRAFERFFATGPLAMLPMLGNRSSIVWAADDRLARELIALGDQTSSARSPTGSVTATALSSWPARAGIIHWRWPRPAATRTAASFWWVMPRAPSIRLPGRAGTWRCATWPRSRSWWSTPGDSAWIQAGPTCSSDTSVGAGSIPWL